MTFTTEENPPSLTASTSSITHNAATLTIANYDYSWYYRANTGPHATCSSSAVTDADEDLTGLAGNTNYTYKAYRDSGCGTELASGTLLTKPGKPTTPTITAGAISDELRLAASVTGNGTLTKWAYQQREANNAFGSWTEISSTSNPLSYTVSGLTNGTDYQFKVRAVNATGDGVASDPSTAAQPEPQTLQVTDITHNSATLTLGRHAGSWWYQGDQDGANCEEVASGTNTASLADLSASTDYAYTAYDKADCNEADKIASADFTTKATPRRGGGGSPLQPGTGGVCGAERPFVVEFRHAVDPGFDDRFKVDDEIVIAATFSQPVSIFGRGRTLKFMLGGGARTAMYASGAGTATLRFRYVVAEGDAGEFSIPTEAFAGSSGTIQDRCGSTANLDIKAGALPFQVGGPIHVPMLPPASDEGRQGFVRVINHSAEAGEVTLTAIDDAGNRFGPLTLDIGAKASRHFNTTDLEVGNAAKGLTGEAGLGEGNWRLEVESGLEVEAIGYIRHGDGFLTAMGRLAPKRGGRPWVATVNPASNWRQVSHLRLFNVGDATAEVSVTGMDDAGRSPGSAVRLALAGGSAVAHDAGALELGSGLEGALGDGTGKWRLSPSAGGEVAAMSLMESPSGQLTNLSTAPDNRHGDAWVVPLFLSASDPHQRQGFVRLINRSDVAGTVSIQAHDDSNWTYDPVTLSIAANAAAHFNSDDLELGNAAKGLTGRTGPAVAGDWWLRLTSELDIEALAYVRHQDGFLTAMHDVAPKRLGVHRVATLNPASNWRQVSLLRILNLDASPASVTIKGIDGDGASPGTGVTLTVPPSRSVTLDAKTLEEGGENIEGALGDGAVKWRLEVTSKQDIRVMSLMQSPTNQLTNLSARPLQAN